MRRNRTAEIECGNEDINQVYLAVQLIAVDVEADAGLSIVAASPFSFFLFPFLHSINGNVVPLFCHPAGWSLPQQAGATCNVTRSPPCTLHPAESQ
jgi:hypothetical protein